MIRATLVDKQSPFLGEECALCKHPFAPEDEIVICPEDSCRHHVHCWRANDNKCTAYGCLGRGEVVTTSSEPENQLDDSINDEEEEIEEPERSRVRSKIRVLPTSSLGCAQGCLVMSIAVAILLIAIGCFGLWAIADYIMLEILEWQYRTPLQGAIHYLEFVSIFFHTF